MNIVNIVNILFIQAVDVNKLSQITRPFVWLPSVCDSDRYQPHLELILQSIDHKSQSQDLFYGGSHDS